VYTSRAQAASAPPNRTLKNSVRVKQAYRILKSYSRLSCRRTLSKQVGRLFRINIEAHSGRPCLSRILSAKDGVTSATTGLDGISSTRLGTRLEIKQSAAWQTWDPFKQAASGLPPKPGPGIFDIAPRTGWFDEAGAVWTKWAGRPADLYVFAWNGFFGSAADHRDSGQWQFFILPATALPPQKTLRLSRLRSIVGLVGPVSGPERCATAIASYPQKLTRTDMRS
jgi:hypothetical protein